MAILIEANCVVIRAESLLTKFIGGMDAFDGIVPNQTFCADGELARVGFMMPQDMESFLSKLVLAGLETTRDGVAVDIVVADQIHGLRTMCPWAEFGRVKLEGDDHREVAACRMVDSKVMYLAYPDWWRYESSLSHTFGYSALEHLSKAMTFLRHEKSIDVYLSPLTPKEVYVGRN